MIINNANLVTMWPNDPFIEGALVAVEAKSIVDFGKVGKLIDRYHHPEVLDVAGCLVLPGMINAHARLASSFAATRPPMTGLHARDARTDCEAVLDEDGVYWSTLVWLLDAIRAGSTTVFAFHESPGFVGGSLEAVARAFREAGVRGSIVYAASARTPPALALEENRRHIAASRDSASGNDLVSGLVGLELSASVPDQAVKDCARQAKELGVLLHVVAPWDEIPRLSAASALSAGCLLVPTGEKSVELDEPLAADRVTLVQTPAASLFAGLPPIDLLRAAKARLRLAMGTDGAGTSLLEELRIAALYQMGRGASPIDGARLALRAAFSGNAAVASAALDRKVGILKPGARADLVVLDYRPVTPISQTNLAEHLLWGGARRSVRTVIANGRVLYHNGSFVTLDEERIRARAREVARQTWERL